jgi:hypothetical protein
LRPECTGMHYVAHIFYRIQKHMLGVRCPDTLFVGSVPVPPKHEKYCVDISRRGRTGVNYVTQTSHRMQKHKFVITCPSALFVESVPVPPKQEK